jgi:hypothetical protein
MLIQAPIVFAREQSRRYTWVSHLQIPMTE